MKKMLAAMALAATACTSPAPAATPLPDPPDLEEMYLFAMRTDAPEYDHLTDGRLLDLGYRLCETFDETGDTFEDAADHFIANGGANGPITMLAASVSFLCPEHKPLDGGVGT